MESVIKSKALKFISALHHIRWNETKENYNELNLYKNDISNEDKILAHWITYISDRQMPFEKIWIFGGYVYSQIIYDWHKCDKNVYEINKVFSNHIDILKVKSNAKDKVRIYGRYDIDNKRINEELGKNIKEVDFTSRFYTSDIVYIYLTLCYLALEHKSSLFTFFKSVSEWTSDSYKKLKSIVYSLYLLSYKDNSQRDINDIKRFKNNIKEIIFEDEFNKIKNNIKKFCDDPETELENFDKQKKRFDGMKRLWCCIRDYLKAYYYKDYFDNSLKKFSIKIDQKSKEQMLKYIELPGDVWNNNSKFRKCILLNNTSNDKLSKILRQDYTDNTKEWEKYNLYPECFDVSFDLAMRMCENNKCSYCLMNNNKNKPYKMCSNKKGCICPLAMVYCGYEYECCGKDDCKFHNLL